MKLTAADVHTAISTGQFTYDAEKFRSMVNYENTDNKGYVRFARGDDGKVRIEKFNNKLDVPLSWRSRTGGDFSSTIRAALLESLKSSVKFGGTKLEERLLREVASDIDVNSGKALSRKEIRAVFVKFDNLVNSATGRIEIMHDVMDEVKALCRMPGMSDTEFLKALGAGDELVQNLTQKYFETVEGFKGGAKADNSKALTMSLASFAGAIANLRGLVDVRVKALAAEDTAVSLLKSALRQKGDGEFALTEKTVAAFRTVLFNDHNADRGRTGFDYALDTFLKNVLPFTLAEKAMALKALSGGATLGEDEIAETVSVDEIRDMFTEYLNGAVAAAEDEEPVDEGMFAKEMENVRKTSERIAIANSVEDFLMRNVAVSKKEVIEIGNGAANGMAPEFHLQKRVDAFTAKFISKKFANAVKENPVKVETTGEKVDQLVRKLAVAGKLSYGDRVKVGENYYQNGYSTSGSIANIGRGIFKIANSFKGGIGMANGLSRSFANLVNNRIDEMNNGLRLELGFIESPQAGRMGESDVINELGKIAEVAADFEEKSMDSSLASLEKSLKAVIRTYVKRGTVKEDGAARLEALAADLLKTAAKRTLERYYAACPGETDPNDENFAKESTALLKTLFKEEKTIAMDSLKAAIAASTMHRAVSGEAMRALENPHEIQTKVFTELMSEILDDRKIPVLMKNEIMARMLGDGNTLDRLFNRTLADELAKVRAKSYKERPGAQFAEKVIANFRSAVAKFLRGYAAIEAKVIKEAESFIKVCVGEHEFEKGRKLAKYAPLKSSERAEVVKTLALDVLALKRDGIVELLETYIHAPESHTAEEMQLKAIDVIGGFRSSKTTALAIDTALERREKRIDTWLEGREDALADRAYTEIGKLGVDPASASEIGEKIAKEQVEAVKARAVLDSNLSREQFDEKIEKEFSSRLDKVIAPAKKFIAEFEKLSVKTKADYAALGEKKVNQVTRRVVGSVLKSGKLNAKAAAAYLEAELKAVLSGKISELERDFAVYSEKYERAYARIDAELRPQLEKIFPGDANGLAAMVVTGFEHLIANKPDLALRPDAVERWVKNAENAFRSAEASADPVTDEGVEQLLSDCGLYGYAENPDIVKEIKAAFVGTLAKSEDALKTITEGVVAKVRLYFQTKYLGIDSYDGFDKRDLELEKKYEELFEKTARGFAGMKLVTRFNKLDANEAKSLFDAWLAKYSLPAVVEEKARVLFANRYKELADLAAKGEEVTDPLLDVSFMTRFQDLVRTDGVEVTMGEWQVERFNAFIADELDVNSKDSFIAKYSRMSGSLGASYAEHDHLVRIFTPVQQNEIVSREVAVATAANNAEFKKYVAAAIEKTAVKFRDEVKSGLENVSRLKESIEQVTRDNMTAGFHELVRRCDIRYSIARTLPSLMRGVGDAFFRDHLQPAFGGISSGDSSRVTGATKANYDLRNLLVKIERAARDYVAASYEAIAAEAMRSVRTGDNDDLGRFLEERVTAKIDEFWSELNTKSGAPRLVEGLTFDTLEKAKKAVLADVLAYNRANGIVA